MFYTVYKTTNKIDGKVYIGTHKTSNLEDGYLGSGTVLKRAIQKHGIENFVKEILFVFDNSDEMFLKEKELVTLDFITDNNTYNLKIGGSGGFDFINANGLTFILRGEKREQAWQTHLALHGTKNLDEARAKYWPIGLQKSRELYPEGTWKDRKHSEETKQQMKVSAIGKHDGQKNSQFGTMWITDGTSNKKVKKEFPIPDGWRKGRV